MILEILQNLPENTCARVSFLIKLQDWDLNFIKKDNLAHELSSDFCEISKNTFFKEQLWGTASETKYITKARGVIRAFSESKF